MAGSIFGSVFRVSTFGESHGPSLGCIIDGCPPGLALSEADIQIDLDEIMESVIIMTAFRLLRPAIDIDFLGKGSGAG